MGRPRAESVAALFWALQLSFFNPAMVLILVTLFHADSGQVGAALTVYNVSGFVASLVIPAHADRTRNYLRPLLFAACFTIALAVSLAVLGSFTAAVVALVILGGPASVGTTLLFAHLRSAGAGQRETMNVRAVMSFGWVIGPAIASALMGWMGVRSILVAVMSVAVGGLLTTLVLIRRDRLTRDADEVSGSMVAGSMVPGSNVAGSRTVAEGPASDSAAHADDPAPHIPMPRSAVAAVVGAFVLLQATNSASVAVMGLYVITDLGADLGWSGLALGLMAALEIPFLLAIGRMGERYTSLQLIFGGCLAGLAYYLGLGLVPGVAGLLVLQAFGAIFMAVVGGVGITYFQQVIPRPGLASGLYMNTRRLGAVVSGPIIALGGTDGYRVVFLVSAAMTVLAILGATIAGHLARRTGELTA